MQKNVSVWVALIAVAIAAIVASAIVLMFAPARGVTAGSSAESTNYTKLGASELKVGSGCQNSFSYGGCSGTATAGIKYGACTIWASANTISPTSSQQVVCQGATDGTISAITGITADSVCSLTHASSTNTTLGGLVVAGVSASSTAGTIVGALTNFTGTTFTWTAAASSSSQWNYTCFDPS